MKSARDIANDYNRLLLRIWSGEDDEYPDLDSYLYSLYGEHNEPSFVCEGRGRNRRETGVVILLGGGGPTVWLNTDDGMLYASTSGDCVGVSLFSEVRDEINDLYGIEY